MAKGSGKSECPNGFNSKWTLGSCMTEGSRPPIHTSCLFLVSTKECLAPHATCSMGGNNPSSSGAALSACDHAQSVRCGAATQDGNRPLRPNPARIDRAHSNLPARSIHRPSREGFTLRRCQNVPTWLRQGYWQGWHLHRRPRLRKYTTASAMCPPLRRRFHRLVARQVALASARSRSCKPQKRHCHRKPPTSLQNSQFRVLKKLNVKHM